MLCDETALAWRMRSVHSLLEYVRCRHIAQCARVARSFTKPRTGTASRCLQTALNTVAPDLQRAHKHARKRPHHIRKKSRCSCGGVRLDDRRSALRGKPSHTRGLHQRGMGVPPPTPPPPPPAPTLAEFHAARSLLVGGRRVPCGGNVTHARTHARTLQKCNACRNHSAHWHERAKEVS